MEYGLIGEKLSHSYSKEIHAYLAPYSYELCPVAKEDFHDFMEKRDFCGINVTIPYKEAVIPYLYKIDERASQIGAVNTIVNKDGKLYGYNTDFFGMIEMILRSGAEVRGKKALILGSGGTSKTALAVLRHLGARETPVVSRRASQSTISYEEAYGEHSDAEIIINTTPVGMYPNTREVPIDISRFPSLSAVFDAIYNPLRTKLILDAQKRGITAAGGLYMLVSQAVKACEIFRNTSFEDKICKEVFEKFLAGVQNIVLIGMPGSGKTTVGKEICKTLGCEFFDTDEEIRKIAGIEIPKIFRTQGEEYFRNLESRVISDLSLKTGAVIATGGGAVLREENVENLRRNGKLFFLDAPFSDLCETSDRPLANSRDKLEALWRDRYDIYRGVCDTRVEVTRDKESNARKVLLG